MPQLEIMAEPGSSFDLLLEPHPERLGVARGVGEMVGGTDDAVAWLCVEGGRGRLRVADLTVDVDGRTDVFEGPGWSALIPPGSGFAVEGSLRYTIVWRPSLREGIKAEVIDPASVTEEDRGSGPCARRVRTYVGHGPLITGETVNPPGGWSSYPPHRHEHEEVYLYRFDPSTGFGVAVNYGFDGDEDERAMVVHDGQAQRIVSGYHPVAGAPGYTMYYLWALAGESDRLDPSFDPVHEARG